jgi:hypothetical protein
MHCIASSPFGTGRRFSCRCYFILENLGSAVGIATGYGLNDRGVGVRVPVGSRIFSCPRRPDWLWGLPNLLSKGYWGFFPGG